jgi:LPXTG-motif cell wall-anchored protein
MAGGGTGVELALAPGYEQTAQVAHYATLMAQAEALQAGTLSVKNSQDSLETTLWVLLIVGLVILAVLLVTAIRRKRKIN